MSAEGKRLALILQIERRSAKMEQRLKRMEDLLSDASQKLCHLIKRQRESPASYAED